MNNDMDLRMEFDIYVLKNRVRKYQVANRLDISEQALYKHLRNMTPEKLNKFKTIVDEIVADRQKG